MSKDRLNSTVDKLSGNSVSLDSLSWYKLFGFIGLVVILLNISLVSLVLLVGSQYAITIDLGERLKINVDDFSINTKVEKRFEVSLDSVVTVPLDANISVPITAAIEIDEVFNIDADIPVSLVLTEKELKLRDMIVPIEATFPVDEIIHIEVDVPIDTMMTTYAGLPVKVKGSLPLKLDIPLKQNIRIKKSLALTLDKFTFDLDMIVPIDTKVAVKQPIEVNSVIPITLNQVLEVPIKGKIPVDRVESLNAHVGVEGEMSVNKGQMVLDYEAIGLRRKL